MNILAVDDNEQGLYMLQILLTGSGFQVETAPNGADALEKARRNPPDLIISDILMPVMDGFALCRTWMQDETLKNIPFVFYTATYTDEGDRDFALSLGAQRFILKPEDPEVFLRIIREVTREAQDACVTCPAKTLEGMSEAEEEETYYRKYNTVLIRKLEDKLVQLERARQRLEQDIAARKRVEEELQRAHGEVAEALAFKQSLLASLPTPVFIKDRDGRFLDCNRAFTEMLGLTAEDVRGKTSSEVWSQECAYTYSRQDQEVLRENARRTYESKVCDSHGEDRDILLIKDVFRDAKGEVAGIIGIYVDLSERKRAEKERADLENRLRHTQKMEAIGQLAGGVAHDFNNVIQAMQGYGQLLLEGLDPNSREYEFAQEVCRDTERAAALTGQLLAFSRHQMPEKRDLDVNEQIENLLRMISRILGEHIELTFAPSGKGLNVHADPGQLDQVFINLCVNARDAMPEGGRLDIETNDVDLDEAYCAANTWAKPGRYALVSVSDTGHGMDEATMAMIFDPFFTTKEVGKGTGLGLATVHGIVNQHGGMIHVYSEAGVGTTLRIYWPLATPAAAVICEELKEAEVGGSETILLAEDDASVRMLTTHMLEDAGYTVIQASDGEEAMARIRESHAEIDLLLSDVVMPKGGGKTVLEFLRGFRPEARVLFMSGYSTGFIEPNSLESLRIDSIQKPFGTSALLRKIREQLA